MEIRQLHRDAADARTDIESARRGVVKTVVVAANFPREKERTNERKPDLASMRMPGQDQVVAVPIQFFDSHRVVHEQDVFPSCLGRSEGRRQTAHADQIDAAPANQLIAVGQPSPAGPGERGRDDLVPGTAEIFVISLNPINRRLDLFDVLEGFRQEWEVFHDVSGETDKFW